MQSSKLCAAISYFLYALLEWPIVMLFARLHWLIEYLVFSIKITLPLLAGYALLATSFSHCCFPYSRNSIFRD
jgi:hypothetical protein